MKLFGDESQKSHCAILVLSLTFAVSVWTQPALLAQVKSNSQVKSSSSSSSSSSAPSPTLTNKIEKAKKTDKIFSSIKSDQPGCFVTVIVNGEKVYQKGFGLADLAKRRTFNADSVFDLASCSKQFTAVAILKLQKKGVLGLDDKIEKFLPEFGRGGAGQNQQSITIRNLLDMTSGIVDYTNQFSPKKLATCTMQEASLWTAKQPRRFAPGTRWDYNNGNYVLLALIVERAGKKPFAEFMKQEIFQPAGMIHTVVLTHPGQEVKNRVTGYKFHRGKWIESRLDTHAYGDGQIMTTPNDFASWEKALHEYKVLDAKSLSLAQKSSTLKNGKPTDYGFGWWINSPKVISHEGGWNGTATFNVRYLGKGSVQVLSNSENLMVGELANKTLTVWFGGEIER